MHLATCQIQPETEKHLNLFLFNRRVRSNGYIVYQFKHITFKLSAKFTIQAFIKNNVLKTIVNLDKYLRYFINYVTRVSGVKIGKFNFKFLNIQCGCKINFHSLNQQIAVVKRMLENQIIKNYLTTDAQTYILVYSRYGTYEFRNYSLRFIGSSFDNLKELIESTLPYFALS